MIIIKQMTTYLYLNVLENCKFDAYYIICSLKYDNIFCSYMFQALYV